MQKSDFEMLSNEELKMVLNDSGSYGDAEVGCVKEILLERAGLKPKTASNNNTDAAGEVSSIKESAYSKSDKTLQNIEKDVRIICTCAVFFVVLTVIGVIASLVLGLNVISTFSDISELLK